MPEQYHHHGKQVLHGDSHFADAATPEAAAAIVAGLNAKASIVTYIESFAHKRGRWARVMFLALAGNIAAGLHLEDEGE